MLRISACSYEGSLFGWNVPLKESDEDILREVKFDYGFHASHGSLRSISCSKSGKYMATGGMNERISVYSLTDNQEMGELAGHSGAITYLQFFQDSFLISASEDHTMYIWRCYDWENIHILGGHTDIVNAFAIHPTGKIALSVSRDKTLKIWNLVQGRCSLSRKFTSAGEFVVWHPRGDCYLVASLNTIQVFSTTTNETIIDMTVRSRINQVSFIQSAEDTYHILYICDNQTINLLDMSGKLLKSLVLSSLGLGRLKSFSSSFDPIESKLYVSFVTSNGSLLVSDGNNLIDCFESSEPLSFEASELAKSTLQLIKPTQASNTRPVSASLSATAAQDEITFASTLIAHYQLPAEPRLVAVSCFLQSASSSIAKAEQGSTETQETNINPNVEEINDKKSKKDKKRKAESIAKTEANDVPAPKKKVVAFNAPSPTEQPPRKSNGNSNKEKKNSKKK
jgi:protein MAK11